VSLQSASAVYRTWLIGFVTPQLLRLVFRISCPIDLRLCTSEQRACCPTGTLQMVRRASQTPVHGYTDLSALRPFHRFIFAQGLVDAVIYGLIEWRTKRVVRKKVRRGMLSHGGSRGSRGSGSQPAGEMTASRSEGGGQIMATMRRGLVGSRGQTSSIRAEQSTGGSASGSVVRSHPGRTSE
jgi:hypothetical protein